MYINKNIMLMRRIISTNVLLLFVFLAFMLFFQQGCQLGSQPNKNAYFRVYKWKGEASGFNGCDPEYLELFKQDPFLVVHFKVIKLNNNTYLHGFHCGYISLLFITNQNNWPPKQSIDFNINNSTSISAWLIRDKKIHKPKERYPRMISSMSEWKSYAEMPIDQLDQLPNVFRLTGTLNVKLENERLPLYQIDLMSVNKVPLLRDYLLCYKEISKLSSDKVMVNKLHHRINKCLSTKSNDIFSISGRFIGYWKRSVYPPLL